MRWAAAIAARERGVVDGLARRVHDDLQGAGGQAVEVAVDELAGLHGLRTGRLPAGARQRVLDARRERAEADATTTQAIATARTWVAV